jgi:phage tail sheath protein FI
MPVLPTYPGVYIEEVPSGVRTITGVATSITAFIGRAWKGPVNEPVTITSLADYERKFGGLWRKSPMSYAVRHFFQNGGSQAVIVRVVNGTGDDLPAAATIDLGGDTTLEAANVGTWGHNLAVTVDLDTKDTNDADLFNLTIEDVVDPEEITEEGETVITDAEGRGGSGLKETFLNVSRDEESPRYVEKVLEEQSELVRVTAVGGAAPAAQENTRPTEDSGDDGIAITDTQIVGSDNDKTGIYALRKTDLFNLLSIPPLSYDTNGDVAMSTWTAAAALCKERRALLIVDAPKNWSVSTASAGIGGYSAIERKNAALYFPRLRMADPLQDGQLSDFAPCGVIAGLMTRTDSSRGVWKAPAGIEANLQGVSALTVNMTDRENGLLNPLGINCLRTFRGIGTVCWGARTLEGQDRLASEWKYVPIRRLALFLEESLFRGTKWVVFEPNDEPLWAKIRMNVGAFMMRLFKQGAFQGTTPDKAFFVKCDEETTTQADRDLGIVNIHVGFAPLKPAEFVIIKIQQIAGEL